MRSPLPLGLLLFALSASALPGQLVGSYTINPTIPLGARNFTSFAAAVQALRTQGLRGSVVFEVFDDAGPYNENVALPGLGLGNAMAAIAFSAWPNSSVTQTVTFRPAPGEEPVIDAAGHAVGVYWNGADHTTLSGFTIRGAEHDAVQLVAGTTDDLRNNRLERLWIENCGGVGILLNSTGGLIENTLIQNCVLQNLLDNPVRGQNAGIVRDGYISGRRHSGTRIIHNTLLMNRATGFLATYGIGDNTDPGTGTGIVQIEGNLISRTAGNYFLRFENPQLLPATLDRNLYYDPAGPSFAKLGANVLLTFTQWQQAAMRDAQSLHADPLLSGTPVAYRLSSASPAIGVFSGRPALVPTDYDGSLRDNAPDCGADEWMGASPEFQINSDAARLIVAGVFGQSDRPAIRSLVASAPVALTFESNTGQGFEAYVAPYPVLSARLGAMTSTGGQILNLDIFAADGFFVRGGLLPDFGQRLSRSFTYSRTAPAFPGDWSIQAQHLNPAAIDGYTLSQATQISVR